MIKNLYETLEIKGYRFLLHFLPFSITEVTSGKFGNDKKTDNIYNSGYFFEAFSHEFAFKY